MQYQSTRNDEISVSAAEAIVKGLAPEGGLFVPCEIPRITQDELLSLVDANYNARAVFVLAKFLTDFRIAEIQECVDNAYTKEKFETDSIAPIYKLNDTEYILELWHGPTCAFKDMALQILPHFLTKSMEKTGVTRDVVILVATSGDTGKAALEGFKDVPGTKIMVFYPTDGVSKIQKLQMVTQEGQNVAVCGIDGNFDDCQNGVKAIFKDEDYNEYIKSRDYAFSSANSINWGRLVPQIVYYVSSYCELLKNEEIKMGDPINVVVPTGNFGNILAAYYAREMGIPIQKFICASNSNNVLTEFIRTGVYNKNRNFVTTVSPSMDILISSNLERFLYHMTEGDTILVQKWMNDLAQNGFYEVTDEVKQRISSLFYGAYCDDKFTLKTISDVEAQYSYVLDTHTAVGQNVYEQYVTQTQDTTKTIIASTASPFKFNASVLEALCGEEALVQKDEFDLLESLSKRSGLKIPKSLAELSQKEVRFPQSCAKDEMKAAVSAFLNIEQM